MYKVLSGYAPLIVCPYHAAVYIRSAPYTGDKVIKTKGETENCKCCSVSKEQHEKALNTPKEEYMPFLLENV